jgi:molybdopterin molybdotransferase
VPEPLAISAALERVLERTRPLGAEPVSLAEAFGRVLAARAVAAVDLPPFPSSAMDGFALRAADTPGTLPVVARIPAGQPAGRSLGVGEAMAISTGGVVPEGADAVVPVEVVTEANSIVTVPGVAEGDNVRPRGGDLRAGDEVVAAGTRLGAAQLGALAAAGVGAAECGRRPRVALLATGSELRAVGDELRAGEIYDSNSVMLEAQARSANAVVERLPTVADDERATKDALERGLAADVLVTSGGVSVGVHDLVRRLEAELGVEEVFWGVAVRPGRPIAFGVRESTLVFGLPGNPVSSLVGFELFVRPALLGLQGLADPRPPFRRGRLAGSVKPNGARDSLLRARSRVEAGGVVLEPLAGQESHMIARAAAADALVLVPRGEGELGAGSEVEYLSL